MNSQEKIRQLKRTISGVFKALRRRGYLARMKYWCCSNCATHNLLIEAEARRATGAAVRGIVHYNEQSEDYLWETGSIYLNFCAPDGTYGMVAIVIGQEICREFLKAGVEVEWDGCPDTAIRLLA
jgi:hypothetical protein